MSWDYLEEVHLSQDKNQHNGMGILEHVLGGNINNVVQMVSKSSGLDFLKSGQLLKMLAPLVMGTLGKTKKSQGLDLGRLYHRFFLEP